MLLQTAEGQNQTWPTALGAVVHSLSQIADPGQNLNHQLFPILVADRNLTVSLRETFEKPEMG